MAKPDGIPAIGILVCATVATVLSWDGYLLSISRRPLSGFLGFCRFAIDITLVFIYMFLLMTSNHITWWLTIHAITYSMYAAWDFLSVIQYKAQYYPNGSQNTSIFGVYWRGLTSQSIESYGPIITICWGLYFWALVFINRASLANHIFITSIFALAGLLIYRADKTMRFPMSLRAMAVVILLLSSLAAERLGVEITDPMIWKFFQ